MTRHTNTATLDPTGLAVRDQARLRALALAVALAFALAIGAVLVIDAAAPTANDLAPGYVGDWKDALVSSGAGTGTASTPTGDWKDTFVSSGAGTGTASTPTGDWKDTFLPEGTGR